MQALGNMTRQRQDAINSKANLMKKRNAAINNRINKLNYTIAQLNTDIKRHPNEGFRNPKVLTKDQMIRKIMTKVRLMTKPQLKRLLTKLNKLTVN